MSIDTIYGVLIASVRDNVIKDNSAPGNPKKGQEVWKRILQKAKIDPTIDFTTHQRYPLDYMTHLANAHCKVLSKSFPKVEDSMRYFGRCFVWFCQDAGHARMLQVAGRNYRDFLNGIDDLHETMRFTYPKMRSPYFLVEKEDKKGCIMKYLSKRQGFAYYVIGQLQECAVQLYSVEVSVQILTEEKLPDNEGWCVRYRLDFDNSIYCHDKIRSWEASAEDLPDVRGSTLFKLLRFSMAFDQNLVIQRVGEGMARLLGSGCRPGMLVTSIFRIRRPLIDFTWDTIMHKRLVNFELEVTVDTDRRDDSPQGEGTTPAQSSHSNTKQVSSLPAICDQPSSQDPGSGRKSSVQSSPAHPKSGPRASPQAGSRRGKSTGSGPGQKSGAAGQQRTSGKKTDARRRSMGKSGRPESSSSLSLTASSAQSKSAPGQDDKAGSTSGQSRAACGHSGSVKDAHSSDHADPEPAHPVIQVEPSDPESPALKVSEQSKAGHPGSAQGRSSQSVYGGIGASGHSGSVAEVESPESREPHQGDVKAVQQQKRCGKSRFPKTNAPARGDSPAAVNAAAALFCPFAHCMVAPKRGSDARRAEGDGTQAVSETPGWGWAAQMEGVLGCPLVNLPASPASAKPHSFRQEDLTLSRPKDTKPPEMSENRNRHGGESVTIKATDTTSETCHPDSTEKDTTKAAAILEGSAAPSQADLAKDPRKKEDTETATDSQRKERGEEEGEKKEEEEEEKPTVLLKGQMKYIKEWKCIAYLCTPHIGSIEELERLNMYLSDLNMYDNSMGVVLNGFESAPGLLHVMEQEQRTSCKIQKNYELQSRELAIRDKFLRNMLPESIVTKVLRQENTCETYEMVTILFSNIVEFDRIVNEVNAHAVVKLLNYSLSVFDPLVEKNRLFKVETRGDAQYMVAGGVQGEEGSEGHTQRMAALALDFLSAVPLVKSPIDKSPLTVRVGIHVGNVVTGTIGTRKRQYCLFGDAVNTAARIHTSSLPGRIHLSESYQEKLAKSDFVTVFRDIISLKGKGDLRTYWLAGRRSDPSTQTNIQRFLEEQRPQAPPEPETSKDVTVTAASDNRDVTEPTSEAKGDTKAKEEQSHRERQ